MYFPSIYSSVIFVLHINGFLSFTCPSPRTATHRPECHDPLKYLEEVVRGRRGRPRVEGVGGETHPSWQLSVVLAFVYILPHLRARGKLILLPPVDTVQIYHALAYLHPLPLQYTCTRASAIFLTVSAIHQLSREMRQIVFPKSFRNHEGLYITRKMKKIKIYCLNQYYLFEMYQFKSTMPERNIEKKKKSIISHSYLRKEQFYL